MKRNILLVGLGIGLAGVTLSASDALAGPASPDKRIQRAVKLLGTNPAEGKARLRQLAAEFTRATKKQPKRARGHFLLGRALFYLSKDDQALAAFGRAIALDAKRAEYHFMRGVVLRYKRDRPAALAALKRALALTPKRAKKKRAKCWYELGDVHYDGKENAAALRAFERAIRADKKHARALFKAGVILASQKKKAAALRYWRRAVKANPRYLSAHYNLGQAFQLARKHKKALRHFAAVVKINSGDWRARSKLVQLYQALGQRKKRDKARAAIFALRKAGKNRKLSSVRSYCRDQFLVGKTRVFAYEHFALVDPRAKRYSFRVRPGSARGNYEISLGSYASTTAIARESGRLKPGQRLFHLDGYYRGGKHRTFGFFKKEPSYEAIKRKVIAIVKKTP